MSRLLRCLGLIADSAIGTTVHSCTPLSVQARRRSVDSSAKNNERGCSAVETRARNTSRSSPRLRKSGAHSKVKAEAARARGGRVSKEESRLPEARGGRGATSSPSVKWRAPHGPQRARRRTEGRGDKGERAEFARAEASKLISQNKLNAKPNQAPEMASR